MILPDVNVLVYAFRREAEQHQRYAGWLNGVVSGGETIALLDPVLSGFLRIVTHHKIFAEPAPTATALQFIEQLSAAPGARWISSGREAWKRLELLADGDEQIRGNLVPDAYLAAVCLSQGLRLATADRGFARYPRLRWFVPDVAD